MVTTKTILAKYLILLLWTLAIPFIKYNATRNDPSLRAQSAVVRICHWLFFGQKDIERNYSLLGENKLLILENNQCWHPSTEEKLRVSFSEWTVRARNRALHTLGEASGFWQIFLLFRCPLNRNKNKEINQLTDSLLSEEAEQTQQGAFCPAHVPLISPQTTAVQKSVPQRNRSYYQI